MGDEREIVSFWCSVGQGKVFFIVGVRLNILEETFPTFCCFLQFFVTFATDLGILKP